LGSLQFLAYHYVRKYEPKKEMAITSTFMSHTPLNWLGPLQDNISYKILISPALGIPVELPKRRKEKCRERLSMGSYLRQF
jgi:hypothetical protein